MTRLKQAVFLAAGRGRRLGAMGLDRPKCLIAIQEQTLLEYAFAAAASARLTRATVILGFRVDLVEPLIRDLSRKYGLACNMVHDSEQVGGMNSVCLAASHLDREFVVIEANVLFQHRMLRRIVQIHEAHRPYATMGLTDKYREATKHIWVDVDGDRAVAGYERDEVSGFRAADGQPWIYSGVGAVSRRTLAHGPTHEDLCQALSAGIRRGEDVLVHRYYGPFHHIATPFCVGRVRREVEPETLGV